MSIRALDAVFALSRARGGNRLVLLALASHADDDMIAWPSVETLRNKAALDHGRSVVRCLRALETAGEIRQVGTGRRGVIKYQITLSTPDLQVTPRETEPLTPRSPHDDPTPDLEVTPCSATPDLQVTPPLTPRSPEPSLNRQKVVKENSPPNKPTDGEPDLLGEIAVSTIDECSEAVQLWNQTAERIGLPAVARLTDQRRRALRQRLHECGGLDGWRIALEKVEASDFLRGGGDRGWTANFDFVIGASAFTKIMEGQYDSRQPAPGSGRQRKPWEITPEAERRAGILEGARRAARGNFGDKPSMRDAAADFLAGFEDEDFR